MVKVEKKKNKSGFYEYPPGFMINDDLIKKLGMKKLPGLGSKLKIEGLVEVTNLSKSGMEDAGRTISFEFKELEIETKSEDAEKFYGKS